MTLRWFDKLTTSGQTMPLKPFNGSAGSLQARLTMSGVSALTLTPALSREGRGLFFRAGAKATVERVVKCEAMLETLPMIGLVIRRDTPACWGGP